MVRLGGSHWGVKGVEFRMPIVKRGGKYFREQETGTGVTRFFGKSRKLQDT